MPQVIVNEEDRLEVFRKSSAIALLFAYVFNGAAYPFYEDIPEPFNLISSLLLLQFSFLLATVTPAFIIFKKNELLRVFKIRKLEKKRAVKILIAVLFAFPLIWLTALFSSEIAAKFNISFDDRLNNFLISQRELSLALLIFGGIFIAPVVEEIAFRVCLFDYFRQFFKKQHIILPVLINSFIFGILHNDPVRAPALVILGIVLQYIMLRYKNLLAAILFHCFHNILSFVVFYLYS